MKKTIQNTLDVLLNPVADTFDNLNQMIKNTDIKTRASIIIGMMLIGFVLLIFSKVFFGLWFIVSMGVFFNWPRTIQVWIRNL